ncbi:phosphoribosyl 1,2-cyclic phosphate phosphodiesterase [Flexibacter flexilis DSM 6793]|uniref:Phosphoribosyl 1,2-cyclic phosphate phosphodiesterase n=1 Tax=Flexibacter flexilis DSM 6793 TaxID=927664 RepID=A0A1I1J3T9_9BACT|nr:MBL fold metallo-hydrolase [Flexibacter flexilis]SFC43227.1 phosphoribosyl 1,2-cyclic phosphate phosphodiesterase [Flexibacter flexilis DSM 6793]
MKITFLGTGTSQGVPVIACHCPVCTSLDFRDKRLRTSVMIETQGKNFVIDTGPDFRQQMLRERVGQLDAVLFTHEHKDHTAGLDEVRAYNFKQQMDMPVYAHPRVVAQLKREFAYIFAEEKYPGIPKITVQEIDNQPFLAEGVPFMPIQVMHYRLPVFGFRVENFTYITDANYIAPAEMDKIRGSEVVVLNGLQAEPHISHFTLAQAIEVLEELQPKVAYLTHISHRLGRHADVEKHLPSFIKLAYDGLQLSL